MFTKLQNKYQRGGRFQNGERVGNFNAINETELIYKTTTFLSDGKHFVISCGQFFLEEIQQWNEVCTMKTIANCFCIHGFKILAINKVQKRLCDNS